MGTFQWRGFGNSWAIAALLAVLMWGPSAPALSEDWTRIAEPLGREEILALEDTRPVVTRYREDPRIAAIVFPDLETQARALNRLGAVFELSGAPRDRVLSEQALDTFLRERGIDHSGLFLGHDYRRSDIDRFFTLADRDGVRLNGAETAFRGALRRLGPAVRAVISIARAPNLDLKLRRAVLDHELAHGRYFVDADYRLYCNRFWRERLSQAQRAAFLRFFEAADYDASNKVLVVNEFQAYLAHSDDPRLFSAEIVGLPAEEILWLRRLFRRGLR